MSHYPTSFDQFMATLQQYEMSDFKQDLAQQLLLQASTIDYGVIVTSGKSALPYVPWIVDGMIMSNKLIIHLNDDEEAIKPLIQTLIEHDIRITSHCQNQQVFTTDISEHRVNLLLLTEDALPEIDHWIKILSDAGLLVLIANEDTRTALMNKYSDDYFFINSSHLFMSRKGTQHQKKRRRSRQRKGV